MPEHLIEGGIPTEALIAAVVIAKYADHLPLYRQAQIYGRQGVEPDRSTLADWSGRAAFALRPVYERLFDVLKGSDKLFADETRAPVLDPGRRKTKTVHKPAHARDDRPWGGPEPPGVAYVHEPDRKHERPAAHLAGFAGCLQVDGYGAYSAGRGQRGYAGFSLGARAAKLLRHPGREPGPDRRRGAGEDRRPLRHRTRYPGARAFGAAGRPPSPRQTILEAMKPWLEAKLAAVSGKSKLAEAIRYTLSRWAGLTRYLDDGRIEIDNNVVERAMRPIAPGARIICSPVRMRRTILGHPRLVDRNLQDEPCRSASVAADVLDKMPTHEQNRRAVAVGLHQQWQRQAAREHRLPPSRPFPYRAPQIMHCIS